MAAARFRRRMAALALASVVSGAGGARADSLATETGWRDGQIARARMADAGAAADGARWVVIEVAMPEGWVTYWRWPGETGVPTVLDWSGSAGLAAVEVVWPTPTPYRTFGFDSYGYEGRLTLAAAFRQAVPAEAALTLNLGVCDEICVPERFDLAVRLDAVATPSDWAKALRRETLAAAPAKAAAAEIGVTRCEARGTDAGGELALEARLPPALIGARPIAAPPPGAWFNELAIARDASGALSVSASYVIEDRQASASAGPELLLILPDGSGVSYAPCAD